MICVAIVLFIFLHSVLFEERSAQPCVATTQGNLQYGSGAMHTIHKLQMLLVCPREKNIQGQKTLSKNIKFLSPGKKVKSTLNFDAKILHFYNNHKKDTGDDSPPSRATFFLFSTDRITLNLHYSVICRIIVVDFL